MNFSVRNKIIKKTNQAMNDYSDEWRNSVSEVGMYLKFKWGSNLLHYLSPVTLANNYSFHLLINSFNPERFECKLSHVLTFVSEHHVPPYVACFMLFYGKHVYTVYCTHMSSEINTTSRIIVFMKK